MLCVLPGVQTAFPGLGEAVSESLPGAPLKKGLFQLKLDYCQLGWIRLDYSSPLGSHANLIL